MKGKIWRKKQSGITLIALIVTIIILLILAGVSISMITGDEGILTKTQNAKTKYQDAEKTEKLKLAGLGAYMKSNGRGINQDDLEEELDKCLGEGNYELEENNGVFIINEDNGSTYIVDSKGNADKTNIIDSIQDLVRFQQDVTNGKTYDGETVTLTKDLDFKPEDPSDTSYDETTVTINGEEYGPADLKTYLCEGGTGWTPIGNKINDLGDISKEDFHGTFKGNFHTITNLYVNVTDDRGAGLFSKNRGTIESLILVKCNINNEYSSENDMYVGGIAAINYGILKDCGINSGSITGNRQNANSNQNVQVGGVTGYNNVGSLLSCCYNRADISSTSKNEETTEYNYYAYAGGVVGWNRSNIENCYNTGNVKVECTSGVACGGIAGITTDEGSSIKNCYTVGTLSATNGTGYCHIGEIVGNNGNTQRGESDIINAYCINKDNSYIYYYYISENDKWNTEVGDEYKFVATDFTNIESTPGAVLAKTKCFKRDTKEINNGYLILNWEK